MIGLLVAVFAMNAANAQTTTYPFPRNVTYNYGYMQTYESPAAAATRADSWYQDWKSKWVESCGGGLYRVKNEAGSSFSEGIGYGMLMAAYYGDKALFDGLWQFYKNSMDPNGLMHWCRSNCGGGSCGNNAATDGDLDAAMALVIASKQWPSQASYATDATTLITAIKNYEFTTCSGRVIQKPGDVFGGCNCTNPSYFAPGYYRAFAQFIPSQASFWTQAATDAYWLLDQIDNASTGLIPAWTDANGSLTGGSGDCSGIAASGGGQRFEYQFDAARAPWRIVTDYLWWGTPEADTWLTKVTDWVNSKGISSIVAGYKTDGTPNVTYKNSAFTGAFAVGAMTNTQTMTNDFYSWWVNNSVVSGSVGSKLDDNPYFQNSLRTIYLFLATGNFWNPFGGTCRQPSLGPDISLCGSVTYPITLNSGTPSATNVTFKWYKNGTAISGQTGPSCTGCVASASDAGTFVVQRDSSGGCSKKDTIVVLNTLPTPVLSPAGPVTLCKPSYVDITASNSAAFPSGTSWKWSKDGTDIAGETSSALSNVRTAGIYKVTASIAGCPAVTKQVTVTSSLPTPVDGCSATPGSVALSITNPGLNGTNYNWYATPAATTPVAGGTGTTTFTTPAITGTTTFWVQDMSSVSGTVGPTTLFGQGQQWGCTDQHMLDFTASTNFMLKAFKIPFETYGAGSGTVTIEILDNTNTVRATYTSDATASTGSSGTTASLYRFTFNGGAGVLIDAATWGSNLKMRLKANSCTFNGAPHWNDASVSGYPFKYPTASPVVSITGSQRSSGPANTSDYMYFYAWEISTGTSCDRIPVVARIDPSCSSLPVQFLNFFALDKDNFVLLSWATSTEKNNSHFEIQRSTNGENYVTLGEVKGSGNSAEVKTYAFADNAPLSGIAYYRIRQVDADGAAHYSENVVVNRSVEVTVSAVPNPFQNTTDIMVSTGRAETVQLEVTDLSGVVRIPSTTYASNEKITVGAELPKGVYIVRVFVDSKVYLTKLVKF